MLPPCKLPSAHRHIPRGPRRTCTPLCRLLRYSGYTGLDIRVFLDDVAVVAIEG